MKKTVLITGSSTGIGEAAVRLFAQKGWNVAATLRNPADNPGLATLENVRVYPLDVTQEESVKKGVEQAIHDFGRLDVLVNNAGYGLFGPFETATPEKIERQYATNVFGVFAAIRQVLPHFRQQRSGTIINITSVGGRTAFPLNSLYHGTKFAIDGFSESLFLELEPFGIHVKIVAPGGVATDFAGRSLVTTFDAMDNPYAGQIEKVTNYFRSRGGDYSTSEQIAEVIYQAATDGTAQLRYIAGADAQQLLAAKAQMSQEQYYEMIKQNFGF